MRPIVVASLFAFGRRRRLPGISLQPGSDIVVIALLRPKHSCERLAQDVARVARALLRETVGVELICFFAPQVERLFELFPERIGRLRVACGICIYARRPGLGRSLEPFSMGIVVRQAQAECYGRPGSDSSAIMRSAFSARLRGIHGSARAVN